MSSHSFKSARLVRWLAGLAIVTAVLAVLTVVLHERQQRLALWTLQQKGVEVGYRFDARKVPEWTADRFDVISLAFEGSTANEDNFIHLCHFPNLQWLDVKNILISKNPQPALEHLANLKYLNVTSTSISATNLRAIIQSCPRLLIVLMGGASFTPDLIAAIEGSSIRRLYLEDVDWSAELGQSLSQLTQLEMLIVRKGNWRNSDFSKLPPVQSLSLHEVDCEGAIMIQGISRMRGLSSLSIDHVRIQTARELLQSTSLRNIDLYETKMDEQEREFLNAQSKKRGIQMSIYDAPSKAVGSSK